MKSPMFDFGVMWFGNDHQRSQCHVNALHYFIAVNQLVAIFQRYWFQVLAACILVASSSLTGDAQDPGYETIRFYDRNSRPQKLLASKISPNGRYLVLTFRDGGLSIVDLPTMSLHSKFDVSCFEVAFSPDSQKLICIGDWSGIREIDVAAKGSRTIKTIETVGRTGIRFQSKQGKLLIQELPSNIGQSKDSLQVGDEIIAVSQGEKPTLYGANSYWESLLGKSIDKATELITGPPGTRVQLRVARRGSPSELEFEVQRQWPTGTLKPPPAKGSSITLTETHGCLALRTAPTAAEYAYVRLQNTKSSGESAVSADGKLLAFVSRMREGNSFGVEIHDLVEGRTKSAIFLNQLNYRRICFSHDGKQLLVGTRDSIEILDIANNKWDENIALRPEAEKDTGEIVNRRIPLGFGFPGDLYTSIPEVVYSKPAVLTTFDLSINGTIAVASEEGSIVLANLQKRARTGVLKQVSLGAPAESILFTPDGRQLIAYARGILHIIGLENGK